MIRNFAEVAFDDIAWSDASSRATFRRVPPLLRLSVREVGVLNPLIVSETQVPDRFAIVTGWLRFQAAREVGENSVPCHIYRSFPPKILLLCSLFDNLGHRHLNLVEQAIALNKLSEFYTAAEIKRTFLPMLAIQANGDDLTPLTELASLEEDLLWAVADGEIYPLAARELASVPHGHRQHVIRLFRSVCMDDVAQVEAAEGFRLLLEKKKISPIEVLQEENWLESDHDLQDPAAKIERDLLQLEVGLAAVPTLFGTRRSPASDSSSPKRGANVLAPGEKARSDKPVKRKAASRAPVRRSAEATQKDVLKALENRLGKVRRQLARADHLPPGARLCSGAGTSGKQRLEVDFSSASQLCGTLRQLLDAEERGALQAMLTRQ